MNSSSQMVLIAALLCLSSVNSGPLWAQTPVESYSVQRISPESIVSLDTSGNHTWWVRFQAPAKQFATPRDVSSEGPEATSAFRQEQNILASLIDFDPSQWKPVQVPGTMNDVEGFNSQSLEMWYFKRFYLEELPSHSMTLRLGRIDDRDRVYLNGVMIGHTGEWDAHRPHAYDRIRVYEIPPNVLKEGENQILVHVRGYFPGESGMVQGQTEIGPTASVLKELRDDIYREVVLLSVYFTAGSYFLFLFVRRRQNRENLLFALFIYGMVFRQLIRTELRFEMGLEFFTIKRIEFCLTYVLFPAFFYFVRSYFSLRKNLFIRIVDISSLVFSLVIAGLILHVLVDANVQSWWFAQKNIGQPMWALFILGSLIVQIVAAMQGNRDGLLMLGGTFFVVLGVVLDVLVSRGVLPIPHLFAFFFSAFILSLALILANRFVRLYRTVEDLNKNLERKVEQRTEELNDTLEQVQSLKEKQDGDYFLTSLLMTPLGGNRASPENVKLDYVVRQKKRFQFKKWDSEIGGDLVAVYDIELRGQRYTVFMNADAMGKSMQGAGGAIVAGTVFKSMVSRSQLVESARDKSPEQWLHECFQELQSVFLGFDGHMLVSAVLGLVDENGLLYYTNAEHPVSVLYRQGKARPLEDEQWAARKLGIHMWDVNFRVLVHRLKPGDIVFMGSDGRDDLLLGESKEGNRVINEDETVFLRAVEQANGDLPRLCDVLESTGEFTDDLSLLSIQYVSDAAALNEDRLPFEIQDLLEKGNAEGAYERLRNASIYPGPRRDKTLARLAAQLGKQEGEQLWKDYVNDYPEDSSAFFSLALLCKKNGNLQDAVEYGERCRLRLPEHARNLANLADCYRLLGQLERARKLASQALNFESDLQPARQLMSLLENPDLTLPG